MPSGWIRKGLSVAFVVLPLAAMPGSASGAGLCRTGQVFNFTGGEQSCVVPPDVKQMVIDAIGAIGGSGGPGRPDGYGLPAEVSGATITVQPGMTLYIEVGGRGHNTNEDVCPGPAYCGMGGFNGGGQSSSIVTNAPVGGPGQPPVPLSGGGGGGASDVRTMPRGASGSAASRLIVAAGAGGDGGLEVPNGNGGQQGHGGGADQSGTDGASAAGNSNGGKGGGSASGTTPGAGGAGGANSGSATGSGQAGFAGDITGTGTGGPGGPTQVAGCQPYADSGAGGGGGGGLSGGGAGGGGGINFTCGTKQDAGSGGGGGGGSSYASTGKVELTYAVDGQVTIVFKTQTEEKLYARQAADLRRQRAIDRCDPYRELRASYRGPLILARALLPAIDFGCLVDAQSAYRTELAKIDPADSNFNAVALPATVSLPAGRTACGNVGRSLVRRCATFLNAFHAYDISVGQQASIQAAADTTLNRSNTATAAGDQAGIELQALALGVYISEQMSADRAVSAAGRTLARAMHKAGVDIRLSSAQAAREARLLGQAKLPSAVLRVFGKLGITKAQLRSVFSQLLAGFKPTASRLTQTLAAPPPNVNIPASDLALTTDGFSLLVRGLVSGGGLSAAQAAGLNADATRVANASTPADRSAAVNQLKADAGRTRAAAASFLAAAIGELS
jgi:hypothetical protein